MNIVNECVKQAYSSVNYLAGTNLPQNNFILQYFISKLNVFPQ